MTNRIKQFFELLPAMVKQEKLSQIKKAFAWKWKDTFSQDDYDVSQMKGADIKVMAEILGVSIEFFIGTDEKAKEIMNAAAMKEAKKLLL